MLGATSAHNTRISRAVQILALLLLTSCTPGPYHQFPADRPLIISLSFADGVIPDESVRLADAMLSAGAPVRVVRGTGGDLKCTVERMRLIEMVSIDMMVDPTTQGLVVIDICRIIIRAEPQDPNHIGNVLAHEIGHVILNDAGHDSDPSSIMTDAVRMGEQYRFKTRGIRALPD